MSRRNAKLAVIYDLQNKQPQCTLTKKNLEFIVKGLRALDNTNFTKRDLKEYEALTLYFSHLTYGK
jgi:hypothetical protein